MQNTCVPAAGEMEFCQGLEGGAVVKEGLEGLPGAGRW